MLEPISTAAAMTLAKLALDKFVESGAGELGKEFTESATKKLMALAEAVAKKIKGHSAAEEILAEAVDGKPDAEQKLANFLNSFWKDEKSSFAQEVKKLAETLHFELTQIEDNSSMTMNLSGNATGWQNKISGGTVNQAGTITINQGKNET